LPKKIICKGACGAEMNTFMEEAHFLLVEIDRIPVKEKNVLLKWCLSQ